MTVIILVLTCLCLLFSCKSVRPITEADILHDTTYITSIQRDSIYLRDSIFLETYYKGDTCYVNKYVMKTQYRDRVKVDTFYLSKTDTIVKTIEVGKKSGITLSQFMADLFLIALVLLFTGIWYSSKKK